MYGILLVEDDKKIQFANKITLERRGGYKVWLADDLADAQKILAETQLNIIVLDIMLPDGSGLNFLKKLREKSDIPVLLLTALDTSNDVVVGLAAGGDDYLAKPYDNNVLLGRIEAILRRAYKVPEQLHIGDITLDTSSKTVYVGGQDLLVNPKEYSLLEQFVQHSDRIMSAEYLYEKVWGKKMLDNDSTVKMTISNLRKRLAEATAGYTITAVRGKGYYIEEA